MAFPFKSEGFWGPLFRRRDRARRVEAPRALRPSKRQLVLQLKAKADKLFNRDKLIFDPLEPRILLNSDITYQIGSPTDQVTAEHQVLVKLVETQEVINGRTESVQRITIYDYTNGQQSANPLHTFGSFAEGSTYTIHGSGGKETITVDVESFKNLTGNQQPFLSFEDSSGNRDNTIVLLGERDATFEVAAANAGTLSSGGFSGKFTDVANLSGTTKAQDTLTLGASGSLSGTFNGVAVRGTTDLSFDLSGSVTGSKGIDASLAQDVGSGKYILSSTESSQTAFGKLVFTAPTTSLGIILGSNDDTLHLVSLPPGPAFTVSGGAGADKIAFDSDLNVAGGILNLTFDGGAGDDVIALSSTLDLGSVGIAFQGGAGSNSLSVAAGKQIRATGSVSIVADATVTPVLSTNNATRSAPGSTAKMAVTINQGATIGGASVAIAVRSTTTVTDDVPQLTQSLSVNTTGLATLMLDGSIDTAGDVSLTTDVVNSIALTSSASSQLKRITPTQTNTSTIVVGAHGAVNGGTVKIAASTTATVDVKAIGLVLPGSGTFTDTAKGTAEQAQAVASGEADLSDIFTPAELAAEGVIKQAETTITNVTQVSVDSSAKIVQSGIATIAGSDPELSVEISAKDRTDAITTLVAKDGVEIPVLGSILNIFALTANQTLTRTTSVDVGVAPGTPLSGLTTPGATVIAADGNVALQAANSGTVQTRIRAATEAPIAITTNGIATTTLVAGDGGDDDTGPGDGSLAAPIKAGAILNTVNDTVRVAVRGVTVTGASLTAAATNDTAIEARAVQARNLLTGSTSAKVETSRLTATDGTISVVAMDATIAKAIAEPIDTSSFEPETEQQKAWSETIAIARGSAINTVERDVTAAITDSTVTATHGGVTLTAENALDLTANAQAAGVSSQVGVAGSLAVNVVNGNTTATITRGSVKASGGDVTVTAGDLSIVDSRVQTTAENASEGSGTAVGGAAAFNLIGYTLDGVATNKLADKIVGTALDAMLGTAFFTTAATQTIRARVEAATVTATRGQGANATGGNVAVNAVSAGTVNATVSNTVTVKTTEQTITQLTTAANKQAALNSARTAANRPTLNTQTNTTTSASSRSIGGIIASNRIARSATADVISGATITSAGELGVRAADAATINSNVKLVASSQASSDGGLPSKQPQIQSDYKTSAPDPVKIKLAQRVAIDFANPDGVDPIVTVTPIDQLKNKLPTSTSDAQTGMTPEPASQIKSLKPGDIVLVGPGFQGKGEVGTYYRYSPATPSPAPGGAQSIDLSKADFTDETKWKAIGEKGAVYAYMGPDATDATNVDLKTEDYSDLDLWRRVVDGEDGPEGSSTTRSGGTAAGGIIVRNEITGGVTATVNNATVTSGSVAVAAERDATIAATTDATVEAIATIREQEGTTASGAAGTGTPSTVPGKTSAFDAQGATALAVNAVIATNTILSTADASIKDATVTTTSTGDGSVSVTGKTGGAIEATVNAQVTAQTSGATGTGASSGQEAAPTSAARAAGIQLAFNAVGYQSANLAFDTLDALVGTNLTSPSTAQARATITNSAVSAEGAITVGAESSGAIEATLGNEVSASAEAASADALAVSGIVAMNRVSGAAQAAIDANGKTVGGTDVTVTATDSVAIASTTTVGASAEAVEAGSATGADDSAERLLGQYDYTTSSGTRIVDFGQKIRLSDDWAGKGEKGSVYQYVGETFATAQDLGDTTRDFTDFSLWKKLDSTNVAPGSASGGQPEAGKISSTGLGGLFSRNSVAGRAEAKIVHTTLEVSGDVAVTAESTGSIKALDASTISGGTAVNGILVSNNVLNGATASIADSTVTTSGGVVVKAVNASDVDARAEGSVAGETTALGFTLAFNTVGFEQQNPLFMLVDTIVGDPLIATATKSEAPAGAKAYVTGTTLIAQRDVSVTADSRAQINAVTGNEVKQADADSTVHRAETGAKGISAGALLAANKVSAKAEAYIGAPTEATTAPAQLAATVTSTDGSVTVSAKNRAGIEASSTLIGSSAVSGTVAELAKKAAETAQNIYDYTTASGEKDIKAGDRVRLAANYPAAPGPNNTDKAVPGNVYVYIGSAATLKLGEQNYADTTKWFAVSEGATVSTAPTGSSSTTTTDVTKESVSVAGTDGTTTTVTREKARYTSKDLNPILKVGDTVMFKAGSEATGAKGEAGTIYIYRGPDNTEIELKKEDYTGDNWIPAAAKTVMPQLDKVADPAPEPTTEADGTASVPSDTRSPASSSKAFGGLIVFNEVNGGATARITDATVTGHADLTVSATDASDIAANVVSTVTASGGASFASESGSEDTSGGENSDSSVIAVNGIATTNVVRGGAVASVLRGTVEATTGDLSVIADNTSGVDATLRAASTTSGGESSASAAVTLAFNSVGYETQNLLFNTIDALIGSPTLADAFGGEVGAGATATIVNSSAKAGGDLSVTANSSAQINATVSNAALSSTDAMKGAGGTGFGVVLASNKVSGSATARIDNTGANKPITVGGALSVTATDASGIASNVQIVTSSTVVKDSGGELTNQSKLNKFLPSDFSTDPNEVQSATIESNLIKNRKDLLPDEIKKLEEKVSKEVARVKQLIADAQALPEKLTERFDELMDDMTSRGDVPLWRQSRTQESAGGRCVSCAVERADRPCPAARRCRRRARRAHVAGGTGGRLRGGCRGGASRLLQRCHPAGEHGRGTRSLPEGDRRGRRPEGQGRRHHRRRYGRDREVEGQSRRLPEPAGPRHRQHRLARCVGRGRGAEGREPAGGPLRHPCAHRRGLRPADLQIDRCRCRDDRDRRYDSGRGIGHRLQVRRELGAGEHAAEHHRAVDRYGELGRARQSRRLRDRCHLRLHGRRDDDARPRGDGLHRQVALEALARLELHPGRADASHSRFGIKLRIR